jgi:hypothetical protein
MPRRRGQPGRQRSFLRSKVPSCIRVLREFEIPKKKISHSMISLHHSETWIFAINVLGVSFRVSTASRDQWPRFRHPRWRSASDERPTAPEYT